MFVNEYMLKLLYDMKREKFEKEVEMSRHRNKNDFETARKTKWQLFSFFGSF
ncbi:hypothetical protein ACFFIX_03795 [Metabacillus herbersteinensis]|uniref:FbpB family small basic protein n=1 Tax=Metabacillus herbersteinensis TaxID=283816 RepID=A0ABV6GA61_9BACI